jgi:predicted phosphoribosyltransferase
MDHIFRNRRQAGKELAIHLHARQRQPNIVVLALARGGVPVAHEVAQDLGAPLDVLVVRKLEVPGYEELAMGGLASGGVQVLHDDIIESFDIPDSVIKKVSQREQQELQRSEHAYRGDRPGLSLENRTVILVDDGLATGSTMHAAIASVRRQGPKKVIVAVPAATPETCKELEREADEVYCAMTPEVSFGVGQWYEDNSLITDEEVRELLDRTATTPKR